MREAIAMYISHSNSKKRPTTVLLIPSLFTLHMYTSKTRILYEYGNVDTGLVSVLFYIPRFVWNI